MEKQTNKTAAKYPFKAIAAVAENGVIGRGLHIPWRIAEDFAHFKRTTMGGVIVMGKKTWESLGCRPLCGRENVVLTSRPEELIASLPKEMLSPDAKGTCVRVFSSLKELESVYASDLREVWICGGAKLYEVALPKISEIILSRVKLSPEGDVFFPNILNDFSEGEVLAEYADFDVVRYLRKPDA